MGCTLCRSIAIRASQTVVKHMGSMLAPLQLGYRTSLGVETAVHSIRQFLAHLPQEQVLLNRFLINAFNNIGVKCSRLQNCTSMKSSPLCTLATPRYSAPSTLSLIDCSLSSTEDVQQGPLGTPTLSFIDSAAEGQVSSFLAVATRLTRFLSPGVSHPSTKRTGTFSICTILMSEADGPDSDIVVKKRPWRSESRLLFCYLLVQC